MSRWASPILFLCSTQETTNVAFLFLLISHVFLNEIPSDQLSHFVE